MAHGDWTGIEVVAYVVDGKVTSAKLVTRRLVIDDRDAPELDGIEVPSAYSDSFWKTAKLLVHGVSKCRLRFEDGRELLIENDPIKGVCAQMRPEWFDVTE